MNYIIFDLEFNQQYNFTEESKNTPNKKCPFEIIQIGAAKLNEKFETTGTMDRIIKPEIYPSLHPFVKNLTGLTIEELNLGSPFAEIYKEFVEFVKSDRSILCVWGKADIKELFRNIHYHELDISLIPKEYINLQYYASKHLNCPKGTSIGLNKAVKLLNIPFKEDFHNAFKDAYYTAEVFKKIYHKKIEPKIYDNNENKPSNRPPKINREIDTYNLIKQFEKMYHREMSEEEKSIIKLAYMMGKTNQFQIKNPNKSGE